MNERRELNNANEGLASTLDGITRSIAEVFGDLGQGLVDFLNRLTSDNENRPSEAEKKDVFATLKAWGNLEIDEDKRRTLADAAEFCHGQFQAGESSAARDGEAHRGNAAPIERELVIPVPQRIRDMPEFDAILTGQRELVAQEQGLASGSHSEADAYEKAAKELKAEILKDGQEIEGEIVEVAQVNGKNYYVVEQDGERLAVPTVEKPEYDKGDEITAIRTNNGFEVSETYGYGR